MSRNEDGAPIEREPLTRERVIGAALDLADASGISALTMRALGERLGVKAMTLYYHVGRKEDLLFAIVESVAAEFEVPDPAGEWRAELRRAALSAHEVLGRHPWATQLLLSGSPVPSRLRQMEAVLGCLRRAGFSAATTDLAYHALDSHLVGSALWVTGIKADEGDDLAARAKDLLGSLAERDLPYLTEHVQQHLRPPDSSAPTSFEFGLDLILDGLDRIPRTQGD